MTDLLAIVVATASGLTVGHAAFAWASGKYSASWVMPMIVAGVGGLGIAATIALKTSVWAQLGFGCVFIAGLLWRSYMLRTQSQ